VVFGLSKLGGELASIQFVALEIRGPEQLRRRKELWGGVGQRICLATFPALFQSTQHADRKNPRFHRVAPIFARSEGVSGACRS
jgi:hypothetical protein